MNSGEIIGSTVIRLDCVDSTNAYLKRNSIFMPEGAVVVADKQTDGRGRRGRKWLGVSGKSLLMSFIISADSRASQLSLHLMWPAVAIINALQKFGVQPGLKWPNDIILGGRKIGGILAETITTHMDAKLVVGIGLNLQQQPADFPSDLSEKAGSIYSQTGLIIDVDKLVAVLIEQLNSEYAQMRSGGQLLVQQKWLKKCCHSNERITIILDNGTINGNFAGIDESGFALLKNKSGIQRITSFQKVLLKEELCY